MRKALALSLFLYCLAFQVLAAEQLVVLYSTSWCGHCKSAKSYLDAYKIDYTNYDIEASEIAKQKFAALNGKGVPLIFVGSQRIDGFNKPILEKALKDNGLLKN